MKIKLSDQYNLKAIIKYLLLMVLATTFWTATAGFGAGLVTIFVLAAAIRDKPIEMLFWVLYMTFSSCGNRNFFITNGVSLLFIRGTLAMLTAILAFKSFGNGRETKLMTPFLGILFYAAWECVVSAQGFAPMVSYLKLMLFFMIFFAMYFVASSVNRSTRANAIALRSAMLAIFAVVILGSVALIPFPGLSLMTDKLALEAMIAGEVKSLFQGMTSHSQVMGPFSAVLATFLFADMVFSIKRWDPVYVLLLLCCPILLYKSSSRTGMGTLVAGIGLVGLLAMKARGIGRRWKGRVLMAMTVVAVLGAIAVAASSSIRGDIVRFVLKWDEADTNASVSMEDVMSSRQALIDESVRNFKAKPYLGNGFQVSESMVSEQRTTLMEYLSAPIEKGVWIYAILEEGGIIGMILFCIWLFVLFKLLIERHAYIGASVFFVFVVSNMGEFSFFSMSYIGGFYWTLTFAAICLDVQRMKGSDMQVFFVPTEQVFEEVGYEDWTRIQG